MIDPSRRSSVKPESTDQDRVKCFNTGIPLPKELVNKIFSCLRKVTGKV